MDFSGFSMAGSNDDNADPNPGVGWTPSNNDGPTSPAKRDAGRRYTQQELNDLKARAKAVPIRDAIGRLGISHLRRNGGQLAGWCPRCGGEKTSKRFWVDPKKNLFGCHDCREPGGDVIALVQWYDGLEFIPACEWLAGRQRPNRPKAEKLYQKSDCKRQVVETYDYVNGELIFQVQRIEYLRPDGNYLLGEEGKRQKDFPQRRPDPERPGEWIWKGPFKPIVYRSSELDADRDADPDTVVLIVEGERKVDLLRNWNFAATCNAGGATKWTDEHSSYLRGADVVIVPDNDDKGRKHVAKVAQSLQGVAKRIRVLDIPGLPPKGDIVDWKKASHTREEFEALIDSAREWKGEPLPAPPVPDSPPDPQPKQLVRIDLGKWENVDPPRRDYVVENRIMAGDVTLLSADGATGKSLMGLQLSIKLALDQQDWLGGFINQGGDAMVISAEDDEHELIRRSKRILKKLNASFADVEKRLHLFDLTRLDPTLVTFTNKDVLEPTPLLLELEQEARLICPRLIIIDALADAFGGDEVRRIHARRFVGRLRQLAKETAAGILLLGHPSVAGMANDSGLSGSTHWHNSVRNRMYCTKIKAKEDGEDDGTDDGVRHLIVKKNNYGPENERVQIRWNDGVFELAHGPDPLQRSIAETKVDEAFLKCLDVRIASGRNVSPNPSSTYAPKVFAGMLEAGGASSEGLRKAMDRLFNARRIKTEHEGSGTRKRARIIPVKMRDAQP